MKLRAWLIASTAASVMACSSGGQGAPTDPGQGGTGGGSGGGGGGTGDTGGGGAGPTHVWPEPSLKIPGATKPAVVVSQSGTVLLAYTKDQKLWLQRDPVNGGAPEVLEDQAGDGMNVRGAADPSSGQALFLDANLRGWRIDGATTSPGAYLIDSWWSTTSMSASWPGAQPVVVMRSNHDNTEYWVHAWQPPPAGSAALPAPDVSNLIGTEMYAAQLYDEAPSFLALSADSGLVFFSQPAYTTDDPWGRYARWTKVQRDPSRPAGEGAYFLPGDSGTFELPVPPKKNASWVAIHPTEAGNAVLTWHMVPECACAVNDVFIANVTIGSDGVPALQGTGVNVSGTSGQTDESDFPVVRPAGGGKLWVAWRESAFGPRAALYDATLQREWVGAPSTESNCDVTQPLSAVVDASGALWLAAVMRPQHGDPEVWLWVVK